MIAGDGVSPCGPPNLHLRGDGVRRPLQPDGPQRGDDGLAEDGGHGGAAGVVGLITIMIIIIIVKL